MSLSLIHLLLWASSCMLRSMISSVKPQSSAKNLRFSSSLMDGRSSLFSLMQRPMISFISGSSILSKLSGRTP